jgi:UDP-N-acetylmuramyl pentapeptide synthase
VFWGVRGALFHGSEFAEEALLRGAGGLVTSGRWVAPWAGGWTLEVEDSLAALWQLAAWKCDRFKGHITTVEGDVGTSTAAMITAVLDTRHIGQIIRSSPGETNAALAATLINGRSHGDYLIVETRDRVFPSSFACGRLARPDLAIIVRSALVSSGVEVPANSATPTTERLQSVMAAGVPTIVNGDDAVLSRLLRDVGGAIVVGRDAAAQVAATGIECTFGQLKFMVGDRRFSVAANSRRQLPAALAAIAAARVFGLSDAEIADGLASYQPIERSATWQTTPVVLGGDTTTGTATEQFV